MHESAPRIPYHGAGNGPSGIAPVIAVVLTLLFAASASPVAAYPRALFEREANDTPEQAQSFRGESQLVGELPTGDTDNFWWTLGDSEADMLWTIELEGETESDIEVLFSWPAEEAEAGVQQFGAAPEAVEATDLLALNVSRRNPINLKNQLIVPPGEHLVSFRPDGGDGSYRLSLTQGDPIRIRATVNPDEPVDFTASSGRQWFFQLNVNEIAIPLEPDTEGDSLWRLSVLGELGAPLEAWIEDADGEVLERAVSGSPLQQQWGRLALPEGATLHLSRTSDGNIGRIGFRLEADGQRPPDEPEPQPVADADEQPEEQPEQQREAVASSLDEAIWVEAGEPFVVELIERQSSFRAFHLDEQQAAAGWALDVTDTSERGLEVCLGEIAGRDPVCRNGPAEALFDDMQLPPGDYFLRLRSAQRNDEPNVVNLNLRQTPSPSEGQAIEPNDEQAWATPLTPGNAVNGRIAADRSAWFDLLITGSTQLWNFEVDGETLSRLAVYRAGQNSPLIDNLRRARPPDSGAMRIDRVSLPPGRYRIEVVGENTEYSVVASPQGPPEAGQELEPNEGEISATPLPLGVAMRGSLHSPRDEDYYYFYLPGWNRVVVDLQAPGTGDVDLELISGGQPLMDVSTDDGDSLALSARLPQGDYYLIASGGGGDEYPQYRLEVNVEAPWASGEAEPFAPSRAFAAPVPDDGLVQVSRGLAGLRQHYFALPLTNADRTIEVVTEQRPPALTSAAGDEYPVEQTETGYRALLPAGASAYIEFGDREADDPIQINDPALIGPTDETVDLEMRLVDEFIVPFLNRAQRLPAHMEVSNLSDQPQTVRIETHASHAGWRTIDLPEELNLEPNEVRVLDFSWHLPADLSDEMSVRLYARANHSMAEASILVDADADAVNPVATADIPEGLLGMPDLAWHALGAAFIDPETEEVVDERYDGQRFNGNFLIDGMSTGGSAIHWTQDLGQPLPPIRLAGDGGTLHGLMFNQRSPYHRAARWREVEISYSDDLDTFTPLMTVELDSGAGQQFFELEEPVQARYVRLRPLSRWGGGSAAYGTGLFRALGTPQGDLADQQHNLMSPALGGHWIYTRPVVTRALNFPTGNQADLGAPIRGRNPELVFGFLQHRAARLSALHWIEATENSGVSVQQLRVSAATRSPVGPWRELGTWELERDESGKASLPFDDPVRARYLKLEVVEPEPDEETGENHWRLPGAIEAIEADTLASGQSILGHWGMDDDYGPMEAAAVPDGDEQDPAPSGGPVDTDSHPDAPLSLEAQIDGRVMEPGDRRSYQLELAEPDNTLDLVLEESVHGRLRSDLIDADENVIPVDWASGDDGKRHARVTGLSPGSYRLDVIEPPRSVVFIWDGSGSVASHQPAIYQALNRFARGLKPGRDVANMMALGSPLLIDGWAEYPGEVSRALASYDGQFNSSNAEPSLQEATRALERRDGERIIFLMTDAQALGRELSVWNDFNRVRPRIITLETNHGRRVDIAANRGYQNLMKSWARVNGGEYHYTTGRTDLIRAFESAMSRLRQPTDFTLQAERSYQEPPRPGSLRVIEGDTPVVAAGVVHLIFDASGSMLQRMEGGRRIDIAKRIVGKVMDERIPEEVPVALRAYGHTEPHSCQSELLVAPAADNQGTVRETVDALQAVNLARTPLAASLDAVREDLSDYADQQRLVVMLTDGEETCDGDVGEAAAGLVEDGLDIRLNIVGFRIDEIGLQAEFERFAEQGGGEYFDSQDDEQLMDGLTRALAATFRVLDKTDREVFRGRVGDEAQELEPGEYELVILTSEGEQRQTILVEPEQSLEIRVSDL